MYKSLKRISFLLHYRKPKNTRNIPLPDKVRLLEVMYKIGMSDSDSDVKIGCQLRFNLKSDRKIRLGLNNNFNSQWNVAQWLA